MAPKWPFPLFFCLCLHSSPMLLPLHPWLHPAPAPQEEEVEVEEEVREEG